MPICNGCGKNIGFATIYQGKHYCDDCHKKTQELFGNAYKGKYLGGHSAYPKDLEIRMKLMPDFVEIFEFPARTNKENLGIKLKYEDITNVQSLTQEKLSALRIWLVGLLALAWKEKKLYMVLSYKDRAGFEQNPVFDLNKIEEIQPAIYRKMLETKLDN